MTKIISILNQKGGVGKTTVALNLSSKLAMDGKKVLLIDFDSQANLTFTCNPKNVSLTICEVLNETADVNDAIYQLNKNLFILPSKKELAFLQRDLMNDIIYGNKKLSIVLKSISNNYDYIIIDNSPSLDIFFYNSLSFSTDVILVLQADSIFSLTGLDLMIKNINEVKNGLNHNLQIMGILFNQYDSRTVLGRNIIDTIKKDYGNFYYIFNSKIRKNLAISEAQASKLNIFDYDNKSNGAIDFSRLTDEILKLK